GANQPITVKAEHERRGLLQGDGSIDTIVVRNCSNWTIEGLDVRSDDNPASPDYLGSPMMVYQSQNLVIRRNLFSHNNRYANVAGLAFHGTDSLIEENEFYFFHRNVLSLEGNWGGDTENHGNIVRRNYIGKG